ncbi:MAG: hypothetical protein KDK78_08360, partial [Chlamydiia bacterium]|nr:hypothetical protein [Chlamydiia bacterium]
MSCEFPVYSCLHDLFEELGRGFQCLFNIEREDLGRERACRFASFEAEEQDPAALEQLSFSLERERNAIHAVAMEEWSCIEPEDKRLNALEGEDAMRRHAQRRQSADYLLEQGVEALLSLDEEEQ